MKGELARRFHEVAAVAKAGRYEEPFTDRCAWGQERTRWEWQAGAVMGGVDLDHITLYHEC